MVEFPPSENDARLSSKTSELFRQLPDEVGAASAMAALLMGLERMLEADTDRLRGLRQVETALMAIGLLSRTNEEFRQSLAADLARYADFIQADAVTRLLGTDAIEATQERVESLRLMPYAEYLKTPEWQSKREQILKWADYRCQLCYQHGTATTLHVHHRTYERRGDERHADLIILCADCHGRFHDRLPKEKEWWEE